MWHKIDRINNSNRGYEDARFEVIEGERFYIDGNHINRHNHIFREGTMYRRAGAKAYEISDQPFSSRMHDTQFSDFIKQSFVDDKNVELDQVDVSGLVSHYLAQDIQNLGLKNVSFRFTYETRRVYFQNSLGIQKSRIDETKVLRIDKKVIINENMFNLRRFLHHPNIQMVSNVIHGFEDIEKQLRNCKKTEPKMSTVLLHPTVASVLAHEVFGHVAERTFLPTQYEYVQNNYHGINLTVKDSASISGSLVQYAFDDEGVKPKEATILQNGQFIDPLLNQTSSFQLGRSPNGRARAQDFRHSPLCRMSNIYIEPQNTAVNDLIKSIEDGYYFIGSLGGLLADNFFQIQSQYGFKVQKGQITYPITGALLRGSLKSIRSIHGVSKEFEWVNDGGCFAADQFLELSGRGSPYLLLGEIDVH